jgi:hypothetical protein
MKNDENRLILIVDGNLRWWHPEEWGRGVSYQQYNIQQMRQLCGLALVEEVTGTTPERYRCIAVALERSVALTAVPPTD